MSLQHIPPTHLPLGYKYGPNRAVAVDPDVMPFVLEAKRMKAQGHPIRTICRVMYSRGMRSARGKKIGPSGMFYILANSTPKSNASKLAGGIA